MPLHERAGYGRDEESETALCMVAGIYKGGHIVQVLSVTILFGLFSQKPREMDEDRGEM